MDRVNEPDENGKISNLLNPYAEKTNLWTKVTKWHFTLLFIHITHIMFMRRNRRLPI
ncbi:hypothetical protein Hanom_Chr00s000326g01637481 [Helianthus anomalus]